MTLEAWVAFAVATTVVLVIPGPTILTVVSYAVARGPGATIPLVAAVVLGDATALAVSVLGLGALLATSAAWFTAIKWLGGLYLLWLGTRLIRSGIRTELPSPATESNRRLFADTWLVTALNPKGIVFFVAFLPQFIDPTAAVAPQLWLLGGTFVVLGGVNAAVYAIFATAARTFLSSPSRARAFNVAGGGMLCAAGLWALLTRRPA